MPRTRRRPLARAAALLVSFCAGGCSGGGNGSGDPASCLPPSFPEETPGGDGEGDGDGGAGSGADTLTIVIGSEDASRTRVGAAWQDGQRVLLVSGGQGGFMVRPALDVTAPAALSAGGGRSLCFGVRLTAGIDAGMDAGMDAGIDAGIDTTIDRPLGTFGVIGRSVSVAAAAPPLYHVAPLLLLLGFDRANLVGRTVGLTFELLSESGDRGRRRVSIVPDVTVPP